MGGILDGGEGGVRLEEVREDLCALHIQLVGAQTANKGQIQVSAAADTCVSVMCGQEGRLAAYSSVWSVEFALRPSERCLAAAALRALFLRLQTRVKMACQRLLTVGKAVCGSVLEALEGRIFLETLREMPGALCTECIRAQAANES